MTAESESVLDMYVLHSDGIVIVLSVKVGSVHDVVLNMLAPQYTVGCTTFRSISSGNVTHTTHPCSRETGEVNLNVTCAYSPTVHGE